jgi:hypothetical protein
LDIEYSREANTQLPLLWLTYEAAAPTADQAYKSVQTVTLPNSHMFISHGTPATDGAAA